MQCPVMICSVFYRHSSQSVVDPHLIYIQASKLATPSFDISFFFTKLLVLRSKFRSLVLVIGFYSFWAMTSTTGTGTKFSMHGSKFRSAERPIFLAINQQNLNLNQSRTNRDAYVAWTTPCCSLPTPIALTSPVCLHTPSLRHSFHSDSRDSSSSWPFAIVLVCF